MTTLRRKYKSNEIIVNTKSNFKSHLVKCQRILDDIKFNEVVIKGMGKATSRAANLAVRLDANNFNTFEIKPKTYTVDIVEDRSSAGKPIRGADKDGFDPDSLDTSIELITHVPAIEIRVRKHEREIQMVTAAAKRGLFKEDQH